MDPSSPKPPDDPPLKHPIPPDDGPRWLSRPDRGVAARSPDAPPPAAGAPAVAPTVPRGAGSTSVVPEALRAQLGAGQWWTYALITGIALLASSVVVAALLYAAREPDPESARRLLNARATPSATVTASATATASAPASASATASAPASATATPTSSATSTSTSTSTATPTATPPPAPTPTSDDGTISTPPNAAGHRVFVDGHYAGDSPGPIKVRCGQHLVKVGSGGTPRTVEVPCGADVVVQAR